MADENKTTAQEQEAEKKEEKKQDPKKEEGTSENLPKTQEEMDRIIEARIARDRQTRDGEKAEKNPQNPAPAPAQAPAQPAAQDNTQRELLLARAELAAIRDEGITPEVASDAVLLALHDAEKAGKTDEAGITEALKNVMKRHPEWKKGEGKTGIKIGVPTEDKPKEVGKALPSGTVVF